MQKPPITWAATILHSDELLHKYTLAELAPLQHSPYYASIHPFYAAIITNFANNRTCVIDNLDFRVGNQELLFLLRCWQLEGAVFEWSEDAIRNPQNLSITRIQQTYDNAEALAKTEIAALLNAFTGYAAIAKIDLATHRGQQRYAFLETVLTAPLPTPACVPHLKVTPEFKNLWKTYQFSLFKPINQRVYQGTTLRRLDTKGLVALISDAYPHPGNWKFLCGKLIHRWSICVSSDIKARGLTLLENLKHVHTAGFSKEFLQEMAVTGVGEVLFEALIPYYENKPEILCQLWNSPITTNPDLTRHLSAVSYHLTTEQLLPHLDTVLNYSDALKVIHGPTWLRDYIQTALTEITNLYPDTEALYSEKEPVVQNEQLNVLRWQHVKNQINQYRGRQTSQEPEVPTL